MSVAVTVGVSESVVVVSDVATTFATGVSVDAPVASDGCNVAVGVSKPRATDLSAIAPALVQIAKDKITRTLRAASPSCVALFFARYPVHPLWNAWPKVRWV